MEKEIIKTRFAWVTAGSENYLPGLKAFFNSLKEYSHTDDVILCSFRLPQDFLDSLKLLPYNVRVIEMKGEDQVQETAIGRFEVAERIGKEYEAICLVEGDIFITANCNIFFEVAAKGFVITGSNGMIVNFNKGYQKQYGIDLGKEDWIYPKVHTTVPIFLGRDDLHWFSDFFSRRLSARSFDDVFGLNVLGIKLGIDKRMICLPPYTFTGIHHFGVKPETGWFEKEGFILSGTEEQVYMIHGKWWDKGWRDDLPKVMNLYFKREGMTGRACQRTQNSIDTGYKIFLKYSKDIK